MAAAVDSGRWTHALEPGGEKRVAGGAVGELAGGASAFYRTGGKGAEAVGEKPMVARWSFKARRFGFDSTLRGRGNEGVGPGEGVDTSGRQSGGWRHVAQEALRRWMESVAAAA
jgi:hypothetical protein